MVITLVGCVVTVYFIVFIVKKIQTINKGMIKTNDKFMISVIFLLALVLFSLFMLYLIWLLDIVSDTDALDLPFVCLNDTPPYIFLVACTLNARNWV